MQKNIGRNIFIISGLIVLGMAVFNWFNIAKINSMVSLKISEKENQQNEIDSSEKNTLSAMQLKNISYKQVKNVDPSFLQLDVYPVPRTENAPVVIFIHGGSWTGGDKANVSKGPEFVNFFMRNNMILVTVNYRLLLSDKAPGATYADQISDVASAVSWVHDNIASYGGNPNNISLLGHSAGAHIAALLGTDEKYLNSENLGLSNIKKVASFDVNAYDIPRAIAEGVIYNYPAAANNLPKFFTNNIETQKAASPINYISASKKYPDFLIVYAGGQDPKKSTQTLSKRQSEVFANALSAAGALATVIGDLTVSHGELVKNLGIDNFIATYALQSFLYSK